MYTKAYFHASSVTSLTCIVMYVGMACIIMVMSVLQVVKRLTKELYFTIFSRRKTSFHAKFQVHCSHSLPVLT